MFIPMLKLKGKHIQLKDEGTDVNCEKTEVSIRLQDFNTLSVLY